MYLVIDRGNTNIKIGIGTLEGFVEVFLFQTLQHFQSVVEQYKITSCIISSVAKEDELWDALYQFLESKYLVKVFHHEMQLPLINDYQSEKLGADRIAAAVAASMIFNQKNVLVVDAGTCINYEFVTQDKQYKGGAISPGMCMRLQAMHVFTGKLPLIQQIAAWPTLIGNDTSSSMLSGAINGMGYEIDGFIDAYRAQYEDLIVVLTGGDGAFFANTLKNKNFVAPNLVLTGLLYILNYNNE